MLCAKFSWNWPRGSFKSRRILKTFSMYFRYFVIISHLKRIVFVCLKSSTQATVRSLHCCITRRGSYILTVVCDDGLKLPEYVGGEDFNFFSKFFPPLFCNYLPTGKKESFICTILSDSNRHYMSLNIQYQYMLLVLS